MYLKLFAFGMLKHPTIVFAVVITFNEFFWHFQKERITETYCLVTNVYLFLI